jgi:quercetin dioxygenase-like cupin family protein
MERRPKQPTSQGPAQWFTGEVWIDPITQGQPPSKLSMAAVHFTPAARTAWHSHEGGQTLYVTEGRGLVRSRGEKAVVIRPGDVVFTPDGEEHWRGATADDFMTHLSITEGGAHWGDHVTEAEYAPAEAEA